MTWQFGPCNTRDTGITSRMGCLDGDTTIAFHEPLTVPSKQLLTDNERRLTLKALRSGIFRGYEEDSDCRGRLIFRCSAEAKLSK